MKNVKNVKNVRLDVVNILEQILIKTDTNNRLYANDLLKLINNKLDNEKQISEVEIRKAINYLRRNEVLPILAGYKGYYISYEVEDIFAQIQSLEGRMKALDMAKTGLINQMRNVISEKDMEKDGFDLNKK